MSAAATVPAPRVLHRAPAPAGSCDTHSHVFGPFAAFPPRQPSTYPLPDASPAVHAAAREAMGCAFGVLTQPAPYAADPGAMLAAISHSGGALRGIASAGADVRDDELVHWSRNGVVGLRFVEMRAPGGDRYPGSVGFEDLLRLAPRMRALNLHAQLWARIEDHVAWLPRLLPLGLPLVFDHMGCPNVGKGASDPGFRHLVDVIEANAQCWVKLVLCRVGAAASGYADARPFHDAFVEAAPERCIWGSDWPYVRLSPAPDAGDLLALFLAWVSDEALQRRILVENPNKLYGFGV